MRTLAVPHSPEFTAADYTSKNTEDVVLSYWLCTWRGSGCDQPQPPRRNVAWSVHQNSSDCHSQLEVTALQTTPSRKQFTESKITPKYAHADIGILLYHTINFHLKEEQDRSNFSIMISTLSVATGNELLPTNCSRKVAAASMQGVCQSDNTCTNSCNPEQDRLAQVRHVDIAPQA